MHARLRLAGTAVLAAAAIAAAPALPASPPVAGPGDVAVAGSATDAVDLATTLAGRLGGQVLPGSTQDGATTAGPATTGELGNAQPLGEDVDGDGAGDLLVLTVDSATGDALRRVLSGATGAVLQRHVVWTEPDEQYLVAIDDHTGDSIADEVDFIRHDLTSSDGCDGDRDTAGYLCVSTWRWTVVLRDGATGDARWERTLDGRKDETNDGTQRRRVEHNRYPFVELWRDVGHGVTTVQDITTTTTYETVNGFSYPFIRGESTAEVIGLDGHSIRTLMTPDADGTPFLVPGGDLTGDGVSDLAWARTIDHWEEQPDCPVPEAAIVLDALGLCDARTVSAYGVTVQALDGLSLQPVWETHVEDRAPLAWPQTDLSNDLTGDARADLVLARGGILRSSVAVVDGVDGMVAWQAAPESHIRLLPLADLDDDGDLDIHSQSLLFGISAGSAGSFRTRTIHLDAFDAATGDLLHSIQDTVETSTDGLETYAVGLSALADINGDGIDDRAVTVLTTHGTDEPAHATIARAYSGADGSLLLDRSGDGHRLWISSTEHEPGMPVLLETDLSPDRDAHAVDLTGTTHWSLDLASDSAALFLRGVTVTSTANIGDRSTVTIEHHTPSDGMVRWSATFG